MGSLGVGIRRFFVLVRAASGDGTVCQSSDTQSEPGSIGFEDLKQLDAIWPENILKSAPFSIS